MTPILFKKAKKRQSSPDSCKAGTRLLTFPTLTLLLAVFTLLVLLPQPSHGQIRDHRLFLEGFEFEGLTKTKPNVIISRMTIRPGDVLTPGILELNQQRLSQTNFFKEVNLYTRPGSEKGQVVVIVEVKERKLPYFQFEGGHNDLDGFYFVPAGLRYDNAFGRGSLLALRWTIGDNIGKLSLSYHNTIFSGAAFIDAELAGGEKIFIHYFGSDRTEQKVGFGGLRLKLGGTRGVFKHLFLAYRKQTYDADDFATSESGDKITDLPTGILDDLEETEIEALALGLYADSRDNPVFPLRGWWGALTGETANEALAGKANFPKVTLDARFYHSVFDTRVLAFHLKAAYTTRDSPFYERFYLGGANSLRGYPNRRLTPEGWGTKLILTNTEFRFPLTKSKFPYHKTSGVLFFDAGGIWLPGEDPDIGDFFTSLGFGIRTRLPIIGMTRFDFAFPLEKIDAKDFHFHISLGHTF
ncbi:MAG: outer membrane protein assembly factor [bacterium]